LSPRFACAAPGSRPDGWVQRERPPPTRGRIRRVPNWNPLVLRRHARPGRRQPDGNVLMRTPKASAFKHRVVSHQGQDPQAEHFGRSGLRHHHQRQHPRGDRHVQPLSSRLHGDPRDPCRRPFAACPSAGPDHAAAGHRDQQSMTTPGWRGGASVYQIHPCTQGAGCSKAVARQPSHLLPSGRTRRGLFASRRS
jgi:hypothetical protein